MKRQEKTCIHGLFREICGPGTRPAYLLNLEAFKKCLEAIKQLEKQALMVYAGQNHGMRIQGGKISEDVISEVIKRRPDKAREWRDWAETKPTDLRGAPKSVQRHIEKLLSKNSRRREFVEEYEAFLKLYHELFEKVIYEDETGKAWLNLEFLQPTGLKQNKLTAFAAVYLNIKSMERQNVEGAPKGTRLDQKEYAKMVEEYRRLHRQDPYCSHSKRCREVARSLFDGGRDKKTGEYLGHNRTSKTLEKLLRPLFHELRKRS